MSSPSKVPCPYCPGSPKLYVAPRGLSVHIARVHKDVLSGIDSQGSNTLTVPGPSSVTPRLSSQGDQSQVAVNRALCLEQLSDLKAKVRVLKHIPKGARSLAAEKLCSVIDNCVQSNSVDDWFSLLSFSFSALRVPDSSTRKSLTSKVKENVESSTLYFPADTSRKSGPLYRSIESKVHEGDLRGAVRLLLSDSSLAPSNDETIRSLRDKHPAPSRTLVFPPEPDGSGPQLSVTPIEVREAIGSFYNGSASGLDGLRPQHLKELTSSSAGSNGSRLVDTITKLCNFLLRGSLNPEVCPYLYGASLCALLKKDGGIRPIAIGNTIRRLTAKLCCRMVREPMAGYLQPVQIGFGTTQGCEAAIHATRAFALANEGTGSIILKIDVKNAFNSVERDTVLGEVLDQVPSLYPFLHQCYSKDSNLFFGDVSIPSQVGAQQGDPLGPLIFCLAIQKVISSLDSPLNVWYLDDGTIGGNPQVVLEDLKKLVPGFKAIGLEINPSKCELFYCNSGDFDLLPEFEVLLPGVRRLYKSSLSLLGAPIFPEGVTAALEEKRLALVRAQEHLGNLSAHVSLVLLRNCFAMPRMTYILRTSPAWLFENDVARLDDTLKLALESILNVHLNEPQWCQASLPVRHGGLGIRRCREVGVVAFLASAYGTSGLVTRIWSVNGDNTEVPYLAEAQARWSIMCQSEERPDNLAIQRGWDDLLCKSICTSLLENAQGSNVARLKAATRPEAGAWLHALPSPQLGTLLDNDSLRIAVALRLGSKVCEPHRCICGAMVEENGHHGLSCQKCAGRFSRHYAINDLIRRALVSANVPCVLEPPGLCRTDGKRPDGLTLVPWQKGRCLLWDATCVSTFAPSHLSHTTRSAGAAAECAAKLKHTKYSALEPVYDFVPVAVETAGPWGAEAKDFMRAVGRRLRDRGCDPRSESYLVQ